MAITGRLVWLTALGLVPVVVLGQATGEPGLLPGAWLVLVVVLLAISAYYIRTMLTSEDD